MELGRPEFPLLIRGREHTEKIPFQPSPGTNFTRRGNSNLITWCPFISGFPVVLDNAWLALSFYFFNGKQVIINPHSALEAVFCFIRFSTSYRYRVWLVVVLVPRRLPLLSKLDPRVGYLMWWLLSCAKAHIQTYRRWHSGSFSIIFRKSGLRMLEIWTLFGLLKGPSLRSSIFVWGLMGSGMPVTTPSDTGSVPRLG